MAGTETLGLTVAFGAGVVSFLSPRVLPLVPAYVSYLAGDDAAPVATVGRVPLRPRAMLASVPFVAGFSAVFIGFGASASALGRVLQHYRYEANAVAAVVVVLMGLAMLGLTRRMPWLNRDLRLQPQIASRTPLAAFALGAAFAFGWTPCIGPVLAGILALTAVSTDGAGIGLLGAYSLGLGLPFLVTALFVERAAGALRRARRAGVVLRVVGGLVMVAMGVAMFTGQLTVLSLWLLDTFPSLATIG